MDSLEHLFDGTTRLLQEGQHPDEYLAGLFGPAYAAYAEDFALEYSGAPLTPFPRRLDFQLNNRCNFKCPMCSWADHDSLADASDPATEFPLDAFEKIVRAGVASGCLKAINFEGLNEPLMKRDLPSYIRCASEAGVLDLSVHTNGLLLNAQWSERLIESGLTKLMVSLDAFSPETFKLTRASTRYTDVVANIAQFLRIRTERGAALPLLRTSFVVQPANQHELEGFRAFWTRYADYIQAQDLVDLMGIATAERAAMAEEEAPARFCSQPFQRMSVKANGDVFPCCCSLGHTMLVGGNVLRADPAALWTSDHFNHIRRLHLEGRYREIEACRICLDHVYIPVAELTARSRNK